MQDDTECVDSHTCLHRHACIGWHVGLRNLTSRNKNDREGGVTSRCLCCVTSTLPWYHRDDGYRGRIPEASQCCPNAIRRFRHSSFGQSLRSALLILEMRSTAMEPSLPYLACWRRIETASLRAQWKRQKGVSSAQKIGLHWRTCTELLLSR